MKENTKNKEKKYHGKQSFLQGALILTIGIVIVKVVGFLFKIPLGNIIGNNGMGYFNTAYTFYSVLYSLATAGFPIAIARMVAENYSLERYNDVRQVRRVSWPIFLTTGSIGTLVMILGARMFTEKIGNPGAFYPIIFLAPSIFFCCLMSIYRGYYEGLSNMYPTAVSEIIEAVSKLIFGLSGAIAVVFLCNREFENYGTVFGVASDKPTAVLATYSYAASAAIIGVTIGSFLSFLYLWVYHKRRGDGITVEMYRSSPKPHSNKSIAKRLIYISVPIGVGSLAMSAAGLIDTTLLNGRLASIITEHSETILGMYRGMIPAENLADVSTIPNFLFGCYSNALAIFMLVPAITQAFGVSALPSLTTAWTKGKSEEISNSIESIIRITGLFCFPAGLGMSALAEPIANLLYGQIAGVQIIARCLIILGIGSIFSALSTPISAMLQAVGRVDLPVKFLLVSLVIKVGLNYFLCGIPEINVLGAGTGTLFCYLFVTIGEIIALCRIANVKLNFNRTFLKPIISALMCGGSAWLTSFVLVKLGLSMRVTCIIAIIAAVIVYVIALMITKAVTKSDILMLPKGEKIAKLLEKHGWIG